MERALIIRATWIDVLPMLLALLEADDPRARKTAIDELERMAMAADELLAMRGRS